MDEHIEVRQEVPVVEIVVDEDLNSQEDEESNEDALQSSDTVVLSLVYC